MFQQGVLYFNGRDPDATHLEHVIRASCVPVKTLGVITELVASVEPVTEHGLLALVVLVPVEGRRAVTAHQQGAHLVRANRLAVIIDDLGLKTGQHLTRAADADTARTIPNEPIERFCGRDHVTDLQTKTVVPAAEDLRG